MKRSSLVACIAMLLLVVAAVSLPALADEGKQQGARLLDDRFGITLGGYLVDFKTDAAAGTGSALGTVIRLEDDLAMDDSKSTFRLGGFYRFGAHHGLDFGYFSLKRPGATTIERQIEFNDVVYDVGARVDSQFDVELFKVNYRYSFVNTGKTEAGFSAGLSTYSFNLVLDGEAYVEEARQIGETVREEADIIAPVPTIGMFINHALTRKWILRMRAEFFDLDIGDSAGRLVDTSIAVDYYFSRHVGIGFGGNTTDIRYSNTSSDPYTVDYRQSGIIWYVSVVF